MGRLLLLLIAVVLVGCGGHRRPAGPVAPAPEAMLPPAPRAPELPVEPAPSLTDALLLPPAPALDTLVPPEELAAEVRLAADSAADEAVLEELDEARPADDEADESLTPTPVSWDIDVDTYTGHNRVQYYLDFFQGKGRERMGVWLTRLPRYEGMIRARLQEQGLPGDLVYLALIESGFSNSATSRAKAVGMWQFMKRTAKGYGLRVDSWVDERRDPYRATQAAARHLKSLNDRFGSLYLAAAAYNAGAGKVSRGVRRLPDDEEADSLNSDATFFRLYDTRFLRRETKDYVPKLIAAARIAKEPARYGFTIESVEPPTYDSIIVPTMTGLDVIARLADTTVAAIRELNPQYLRLATPPGVSSVVRVPTGRGPATVAAYAKLPPSRRITFLEHTVARGETLSGIAHRYHVSTRLVVEANPRIRGRALRPGMRVIVPTGGALSTSVARRVADPVEPASSSPSGFHRVRRGETLSGLAQEYGVTVRQIQAWNALGSSQSIRAGQRLRVTPPAGRRSRAPAAASSTMAASGERVHTVRRGETLGALAKRYGVSVQALLDANHLSANEALKAGVTLRIPG
jgi:membrane-bound lytic murein transglycosylase D